MPAITSLGAAAEYLERKRNPHGSSEHFRTKCSNAITAQNHVELNGNESGRPENQNVAGSGADLQRPILMGMLGTIILWAILTPATFAERTPNIVIMFTDDQGYGDLSCFGSKDIPTPHIDKLATEGVRFTDFYASQPVCSASRASLLTGCYANRVGIKGALFPDAKIGLDPAEHTIAEVVKPLGYATACFGKWHLGFQKKFLPISQGFDRYIGIPYSNDMWPGIPERGKGYPALPWYNDAEVAKTIDDLDDQETITKELTEAAVGFIHDNGEKPFLLYVPHSMPHVPLGVTTRFRQTTKYGMYGDVIREIDWSIGEIRKALEEEGVLDDTLIVFTSDNGPWLNFGDHAGLTGGLREGKGTTFEGGVRVPCVMRYPRLIPAGSECNQPAMTIDLLPSVVELTGGKSPELEIDGKSIVPLMRGDKDAVSPHDAYYYWYLDSQLQAMRMGKWKLHFPHGYRSLQGRAPGNNGNAAPYTYNIPIELSLFDLETDRNETTNVIEKHRDIAEKMMAMADKKRAELGDSLTKVTGNEVRGPGKM